MLGDVIFKDRWFEISLGVGDVNVAFDRSDFRLLLHLPLFERL